MFRKSLINIFLVLLIFSRSGDVMAAGVLCYPKLWVINDKLWDQPFPQKEILIKRLSHNVNKYLKQDPSPMGTLGSAGKISINDPMLKNTRKAFQDADHAAVFSLLFKLTNDSNYLNKTREILLAWSSINVPTGNPIDETRLEGMVWAYDLVACSLSENDRKQIERWFEAIRQKKMSWHFGPSTSINNHRVHQLKMLLLLDKVLNHPNEWDLDLTSAKKYSLINIDPQSGVTVDFLQRHALHYQNYSLKAWLEISLVSGCCQPPVDAAFKFLINKIRSNQIANEFVNSEAKIDGLRDEGGFSYAKKGGTFDIKETVMPIVTYFTLVDHQPDADLWALVHGSKNSPWLSFLLARRVLWQEGHFK